MKNALNFFRSGNQRLSSSRYFHSRISCRFLLLILGGPWERGWACTSYNREPGARKRIC